MLDVLLIPKSAAPNRKDRRWRSFLFGGDDGCEKPYERISSSPSEARVSAPRDILFALAEPATRGRGSIPGDEVYVADARTTLHRLQYAVSYETAY